MNISKNKSAMMKSAVNVWGTVNNLLNFPSELFYDFNL